MGLANFCISPVPREDGRSIVSELIAKWKNEIVSELSEARDALAEAIATAKKATEQHEAALSTVETVKAALARLPRSETDLALPITGRVSDCDTEAKKAAHAALLAGFAHNEAAARVARLEMAERQLNTILTVEAEPAEVAA